MICTVCGKRLSDTQTRHRSQPSHRVTKGGPYCSRRCSDRAQAERKGGKVALDNRPVLALGKWQLDPRGTCPICDGRKKPSRRARGTCPGCGDRGCAATSGCFTDTCRSCIDDADLGRVEKTVDREVDLV